MAQQQKLLSIIKLTQAFQGIKRNTPYPYNHLENDVEHSYQLAMVVWFLCDTDHLQLDKNLLIKYALIHDLVEVYAGDTEAHLATKAELASKREREEQAQQRLAKEFDHFSEIHSLIERYEQKSDKESKLVYTVDKILPVLNVYLTSNSYYRVHKISWPAWKKWLNSKLTQIDPSLMKQPTIIAVLVFLKRHPELFYRD